METISKKEPLPRMVEDTASAVVDSAFSVHKQLGPGLLERAYESCLIDELRNRGLEFKNSD